MATSPQPQPSSWQAPKVPPARSGDAGDAAFARAELARLRASDGFDAWRILAHAAESYPLRVAVEQPCTGTTLTYGLLPLPPVSRRCWDPRPQTLSPLPAWLPTLPRSRVASPAELLGRACSVARFWTSSADNQPDGDDGSDEALRARPGDRVGCLAPNVHEVLITHYAVAALRGVVVNLNYRLSPPEMACETDVARGRGVGAHIALVRHVLVLGSRRLA